MAVTEGAVVREAERRKVRSEESDTSVPKRALTRKSELFRLEYCTRITSLFARANMERDTSEMSTKAIAQKAVAVVKIERVTSRADGNRESGGRRRESEDLEEHEIRRGERPWAR